MQVTNWDEILGNNISEKELLSRICKDYQNSIARKQMTQLKKKTKDGIINQIGYTQSN